MTELLRDSVRSVLAAGGDHDSVRAALEEQGWAELVSAEGDAAWRVLFEEAATSLSPVHPLELLFGCPLIYARVARASGAARYVVLSDRSVEGTLEAGEVSLEPAGGIDPDWGLRTARRHASPRPFPDLDPGLIGRAQVLNSCALLALSERMLAIAVDHVTTRHQFGRPVGSFQAVKHLLADCAVELESVRAVLAYASETVDPVAVTAARALAGRTSHVVGRAAQQVTGAMGFSWEFPLHRYIRRAHSCDLMLGPWQAHTRSLGELVLSLPAVPLPGGA